MPASFANAENHDRTVELPRPRPIRSRSAALGVAEVASAVGAIPRRRVLRVDLLTSAVVILIISLVSFAWISVGSIIDDNVPSMTIVVALFVLFFVIMGFCAVIARDYRDRVQLAAVAMVRSEIQASTAEVRKAIYTFSADFRREQSMLRAELIAQLDTLPGRFETYAEAKVDDAQADAAIAGQTPTPPTTPPLTLVRQRAER